MNGIHQLYCTHCTFGSSSLERGKGEMASRVLGYSARAATATGEDLRRQYRRVERYLYYSLPLGTPAEDRKRLADADPETPRRFFYYPGSDGFHIVGQACWRQKDTSSGPSGPRYGSYFAHVLVGDNKIQPWSVLDCLALWGAAWTQQDDEQGGHDLPPLATLGDLWRHGRSPAVTREVLRSFLAAEHEADFYDPGKIIPDRWRQVPAAQRAALVADTLGCYLDSLVNNRRESVLLVIEPCLAALVFFGVASLVPAGLLREGISVSTFEPNPDALTTTLAATQLHPSMADLKPESYRGRNFVLNTQSGGKWNRPPAQAPYGELMVRKLVDVGWPAVDRALQRFADARPVQSKEELRPQHVRDLVEMASLDPHVDKYLAPDSHATPLPAVRGEAVTRYLARRLGERIGRLQVGSETLAAISPERQVAILNLLGSAKDDTLHGRIQILARSLCNQAPDRLPALLLAAGVPATLKADLLVSYIRQARSFPAQCEALWKENPPLDGPNKERLLSRVLGQLDPSLLQELCVPGVVPAFRGIETGWEPFFVALVRVCATDLGKRELFTRLLEAMRSDVLLALFQEWDQELRQVYPRYEPVLQVRLEETLPTLYQQPQGFSQRLSLLEAWRDWLPPETAQRIASWTAVRAALRTIAELREQERALGGLGKRQNYSQLARSLADSLRDAMYDEPYEERRNAFLAIGHAMLHDPAFWKSRVPRTVENLLNEEYAIRRLSGKVQVDRKLERGSQKLATAVLIAVLFAVLVPLCVLVPRLFYSTDGDAKDDVAAAEKAETPAKKPKSPARSGGKSPRSKTPDDESQPDAEKKAPADPAPAEAKPAAPGGEAAKEKPKEEPAETAKPVPEPPQPKPPDVPAPPVEPKEPPPGKPAGTVGQFVAIPRIELRGDGVFQPLVITEVKHKDRCTLALRGVEQINRSLSDEASGPLQITPGTDNLGGLRVRLAESEGHEYAKFWIAGNRVQFKWEQKPSLSEEQQEQLQWLAACILEVREDGFSRFFALTRQVRMSMVDLKPSGIGEMSKSVSWEQPLPPEHPVLHLPLFLGPAKVHVGERDYEVAAEFQQKPPLEAEKLMATWLGVKRVLIDFVDRRDNKTDYAFQFFLRASAGEDLNERIAQKSRQGFELDKQWRILKGFDPGSIKTGDTKKDKRLEEFLVAADLAAKAMNITDLRPLPAKLKPASGKPADYKSAREETNRLRREHCENVKRRLLGQGEAELRKLEREIEELKKQRRPTDPQIAKKLEKVTGLSAVLYYELAGIRVDAVLLGSPFKPSAHE